MSELTSPNRSPPKNYSNLPPFRIIVIGGGWLTVRSWINWLIYWLIKLTSESIRSKTPWWMEHVDCFELIRYVWIVLNKSFKLLINQAILITNLITSNGDYGKCNAAMLHAGLPGLQQYFCHKTRQILLSAVGWDLFCFPFINSAPLASQTRRTSTLIIHAFGSCRPCLPYKI